MRARKLVLTGLLLMGAFFGPFGGNMIMPMFGVLKAEFSVDVFLLGLSVTFFMIPFSAAQLFSGFLSDVVLGRKAAVSLGFLTYGLGSLFASMSTSIWAFLASRGVQGIGAALVIPSVMALVGDSFEAKNRGKVMGGMAMATTLGGTVGPLFGGFFADVNWRIGFVAVSILTFSLALAAFSILPQGRRAKGEDLGRVGETLRDIGVWTVGLLGFLLFFSRISMYTYIADLLTSEGPGVQAGGVLSLAGIGGLLAGPVAGTLTDRLGRRRALFAGLVLSAVVLSSFLMPLGSLPLLVFLMGFSITHAFTPLNTIAIEIEPKYRATVASVYGSIRFLGYAFGPPLAYPLYAAFSLKGVAMVGALAMLLGLLLASKLLHA